MFILINSLMAQVYSYIQKSENYMLILICKVLDSGHIYGFK